MGEAAVDAGTLGEMWEAGSDWLALRGLQAMVTYAECGLAAPGDTLFTEIAQRLAQRAREEREGSEAPWKSSTAG